MNPRQTSPPDPDDDRSLAKMLSVLKELEPPLEARIANRRAIAAELSSFPAANLHRPLPWWRRSVPVPMPIAVSLAVLMAIAVPWSIRSGQQQRALLSSSELASSSAPQVIGHAQAPAGLSPETRPVFKHYETATYVCGIGQVSSEAYLFAEGGNP